MLGLMRVGVFFLMTVSLGMAAQTTSLSNSESATASAQPSVPAGVWIKDDRPTPLAQKALTILQAADQEGLDPRDYEVTALASQQQGLNDWFGARAEQAQIHDVDLTRSMLRYLKDVALGRVSAQSVHHDFDQSSQRDFDPVLHLNKALNATTEGSTFEEVIAQAAPNFPLYPALKLALAQYRLLISDPAWDQPLTLPEGKKLEECDRYEDIDRLQIRLQRLGDVSSIELVETYEQRLVQGIESFQTRHGLLVDGVLGPETLVALNVTPADRVKQIALSMERLRWTPLQQGDRLIVVNIPGFRLYAYEVDAEAQLNIKVEMRVVIGRSLNHRTPIFDEDMQFIEFSPYWNIPISIARSETIPAIERDPAYMAKQGMEFVDREGNVLQGATPERLQAVRQGALRIRQRPGPSNALGDIKFIFPNNQNIYMHHTPATQLFSRTRRDFSHGCIRLEDPVALAKFVLESDPKWTEAGIREAMSAGRSRTIKLSTPLPVLIGYSTVLVRDGVVSFYPDVYGHDQLLAQALEKAKDLE